MSKNVLCIQLTREFGYLLLFEGVEEIETTDCKERIMEVKKLGVVEFWHTHNAGIAKPLNQFMTSSKRSMETRCISLNSM